MSQFTNLINSFAGKRVMIVGDVMVDSYLWGVVDRISPEAPVPVVDVNHREERLGGAANVALNIKALGAEALLCSVIGDEPKGDVLLNVLEREGMISKGILRSPNRITTTKFRIIGNNSQLLRVDEEMTSDLDEADEMSYLELCQGFMRNESIDVMIMQDYNKGILTPNVIHSLIMMANDNHIPVVVDPKKKNFELYRDVDLFKPNLKELKEGLKIDFSQPDEDVLRDTVSLLMQKMNAGMAMVTLSEHGVFIASRKGSKTSHHLVPAHKRNIADVSGAGDTVVGVAALCLACGMPAETIAMVSNLAGGIVCEKVGVVPIDKPRLLAELAKLDEQ